MAQDYNKQDPNAWIAYYQRMVEAQGEQQRELEENARWAILAFYEVTKDMTRPEWVRALAQLNRESLVGCLRQYVSSHDTAHKSWQWKVLEEHGLAE